MNEERKDEIQEFYNLYGNITKATNVIFIINVILSVALLINFKYQ